MDNKTYLGMPVSNMAILSGIVERNPFYKETYEKGKRRQYATFLLKVPKIYRNGEFDSIRIRAYDMNAVYVNENIFEKMEVEIQGYLHNYTYLTDEGIKVWALCVVADDLVVTNAERPQVMDGERYTPIVFPEWMEKEMNEIFK